MKITFDHTASGTAKVGTRRKRVPGQWIVFREQRQTAGIFPEHILFSAASARECHEWIEKQPDRRL
jgi:hypothetical protein